VLVVLVGRRGSVRNVAAASCCECVAHNSEGENAAEKVPENNTLARSDVLVDVSDV